MATTKKDTTMQERLADLAAHDGVGGQEETAQDPMTAMVEKMVEEALAKRTAELDAREAELNARAAELNKPAESDEVKEAPIVPVVSNAWNETREVFLPYATKGEEQFIFVAVNGRKYQVPRGRNVTVPLPLYERIKIMQEAESRTVEYRNSLPDEAYPGMAEAKRIG